MKVLQLQALRTHVCLPSCALAAKSQVKSAMIRNNTEIVVIVEAYETYTSAAVQCQYSYRVEDIGFHEVSVTAFSSTLMFYLSLILNNMWSSSQDFVPCVLRDENGVCTVDLKRFHRCRPISEQGLNV